MKKIMLVFGTRPEAIKMCPLVKELRENSKFCVKVCVTGQHKKMLEQVLDCFSIVPDYDLSVMSNNQNLFDITINILAKIKQVLELEQPDIVLVHGDTTTAFVASLASFYLGIKIGHVEAGLRTRNLQSPFPEEFNRQSIGVLANYHFAPTTKAKQNLLSENKAEKAIFVTGNTAIDALKTTIRDDYKNELFAWLGASRLILLTAHRRENLGTPLKNMFSAIRRIVNKHNDIKVIYPVHLNPLVRKTAQIIFQDNDRIKLIEPLDVVDFHNIMARSYLILTDSGGIQEEAPSLGKPVLVMRDTTERQEGVEAGTLKLVGTNEDHIFEQFDLLLSDSNEYKKMSSKVNPFGDGFACKYIVSILEKIMVTQ